MSYTNQLLETKRSLKEQYLQLIEDAYNYKQVDHALSDISEYDAIKLLNQINELKFVVTDNSYSF